jgi:hypothetical protein
MDISRTSSCSMVDCPTLACSTYNSILTSFCCSSVESDELMWLGLFRICFKLYYRILVSTVPGLLSLAAYCILYLVILLPEIVKCVASYVLYIILNCQDREADIFPLPGYINGDASL